MTIIVVNKINNKIGIINILKFSITNESNFSGPICIKAIRIHEIYPIHLIGFESFDIAFKYSCIAIAAIIAKNTSGFAGADLENVLNEAALLAARRNLNEISMREIEDAMVKVTMGPEKKTKVRSDKENRLVAYHEAGHAVVSHFLSTQDPVHQISIVPRGMAGGYTMYRPTEDKSFMSKTEMEENIVSLLGGRVAEALILNDISTGASNDIERATKIARSMVTQYGMSERIGTITLGQGQEEVFLGRDLAHAKEYSEETAAVIDEETKRIVDTGYNRAKQILTENIDKLHQVAGILLEKEKIEADEFEEIFR